MMTPDRRPEEPSINLPKYHGSEPKMAEPTKPYEARRINHQNFRITHVFTDSRVATCYSQKEADMVAEALNLLSESKR